MKKHKQAQTHAYTHDNIHTIHTHTWILYCRYVLVVEWEPEGMYNYLKFAGPQEL